MCSHGKPVKHSFSYPSRATSCWLREGLQDMQESGLPAIRTVKLSHTRYGLCPLTHVCLNHPSRCRGRYAFITSLQGPEYFVFLRELQCTLKRHHPEATLVVLARDGDLDIRLRREVRTFAKLRVVKDLKVTNYRCKSTISCDSRSGLPSLAPLEFYDAYEASQKKPNNWHRTYNSWPNAFVCSHTQKIVYRHRGIRPVGDRGATSIWWCSLDQIETQYDLGASWHADGPNCQKAGFCSGCSSWRSMMDSCTWIVTWWCKETLSTFFTYLQILLGLPKKEWP